MYVSKQFSAASDLALHCLLMSHRKDARLIWFKDRNTSLFVRILVCMSN